MTSHLADILTGRLMKFGLINESDRDDYNYSIQVIIEKILGYSVIFIMAICFNLFLETVLFVLFFSNIRKRTGGFHANSFLGCFIATPTSYLVYVFLVYPFLLKNIHVNIVILFISLIIVLIFGAVNHPNMHWNIQEYEMSKKSARAAVLIEVSCIIALIFLGMSYSYILFMSYGVILSAFLLLLAKLIEQEV